MTDHVKRIAERTERESRDDYPAVMQKLSDGWRLIVSDLEGSPEIELQFLDGKEWIRYIGECAGCAGMAPEDLRLLFVRADTH